MSHKYHFDYIILLTGQSNALGVGGCYNPYNLDDQPDNRIWGYVSGQDYWTIFDLRLQIGSKKPYNQCMAFHYAKRLLRDNPHWKIGIIISGLSGQSITRWIVPYNCNCPCGHLQPSVIGKRDKGDIYAWSLLMVNNALHHCTNETHVNTIMWHQGESDCMETQMWYYERLCKVFEQYKSNEWFHEDSMFMCGQLYENGCTNSMNSVLTLQHGWKFFMMYQLSFDNIHFYNHSIYT